MSYHPIFEFALVFLKTHFHTQNATTYQYRSAMYHQSYIPRGDCVLLQDLQKFKKYFEQS